MEVFLHVIIVLEMIYVNIYTACICSRRKKSKAFTWSVFHIFTILLVGSMLQVLPRFSNYGNGNGLFILMGVFYLIPLHLLLDQPLHVTAALTCSAWIYTMTVFALSVRIGYFFPKENFTMAAAAVQTGFYLVSLPFFLKFMKEKFTYLLENIGLHMKKILLGMALLCFLCSVLLNYVLIMESSNLLKLILVILFGADAGLCYWLYYALVYSNTHIKKLMKDIHYDPLTGLKNRYALWEELQVKMKLEAPFYIYFIDLDCFKSINDQYGHMIGDLYLKGFAKAVTDMAGEEGDFYRLSGDEFVFLYDGAVPEQLMGRFLDMDIKPVDNVDFAGFSIGCAEYPDDGDTLSTLIARADFNMYKQKKEKKKELCR